VTHGTQTTPPTWRLMTAPHCKHPIKNSELANAGISRKLYNQRLKAGWTHDQALAPVLTSTNDVDDDRPLGNNVVYEISDHIRIRQLSRDGLSTAGLQRRFPHIEPEHLEDIINGVNFIPSNT
jgi:hypothetical protein